MYGIVPVQKHHGDMQRCRVMSS